MTVAANHVNIHPLAIVEEGAILGDHVTVEAYAIVKSTVELKDHVTVKSHAYVGGHTTIGKNTIIYPFACIGTKSQDLKYRGEKTTITIGHDCEIREYVTINSSTGENSQTTIGDHCLIMAYCHIAHNSTIGNHVIMSNLATLAGHVTIQDHVIIGGMTPIHQFVRIGSYAMVGGMSRITHDIPPYTLGAGVNPFKFGGLNMIGLKRHGFNLETRTALSRCFKMTYRESLHLEEAVKQIEEQLPPLPEVLNWVHFCTNSKRGLIGLQGVTQACHEDEEELDFFAEVRACLI